MREGMPGRRCRRLQEADSGTTTPKVQQRMLALVDLALPLGSCPAAESIVEGIAKAGLLFQVAQQAARPLAYNIMCTSKPDTTSCSMAMRDLARGKRERPFVMHLSLS